MTSIPGHAGILAHRRRAPLAWQAFGASVRGAAHVRDGRPNQDSLQLWTDQAGYGVVAVSDGHGSRLHPRSGTGAHLATDVVVEVLRLQVHANEPPSRGQQRALVAEIGRRWRQAVTAHLLAAPFGGEERPECVDERRALADNPTIAYGATLLAAAATPEWILIVQLGDGDILTVTEGGRTSRPLPPDPRLVGGRTLSLCQPAAWSEARMTVLAGTDVPALILVSSDGYANSFRTDDDFRAIGPDYLDLLKTDADDARTRLPHLLGEASEHGSGDDVTLGVLYRRQGSTHDQVA